MSSKQFVLAEESIWISETELCILFEFLSVWQKSAAKSLCFGWFVLFLHLQSLLNRVWLLFFQRCLCLSWRDAGSPRFRGFTVERCSVWIHHQLLTSDSCILELSAQTGVWGLGFGVWGLGFG